MGTVLAILDTTLILIIDFVQFCMLLHAILSLFFPPEAGTGWFCRFLSIVVDLATLPMRWLFDRMGWGKNSPLNLPFLASIIFYAVLSTLLTIF